MEGGEGYYLSGRRAYDGHGEQPERHRLAFIATTITGTVITVTAVIGAITSSRTATATTAYATDTTAVTTTATTATTTVTVSSISRNTITSSRREERGPPGWRHQER